MAGLNRMEGWEDRLAALIQAARGRPFSWGAHDCCLWAADGVLALTGTDLAAAWRGRYRTEGGAARLLARLGGIEALGRSILGAPLSTPLRAMRGDVAVLDNGHGDALGIVIGAAIAYPGADGLVFVPLTAARLAWRIG